MMTPSPKSRLRDLMSLLDIHCSVVVNDTGVLTRLFMVGVLIELPYASVHTPICIRDTATTTLLLYAVAVIG